MAMMDSSAWNVSDHPMHPTTDDDFQQFLDMNGMSNLADSLSYEFQDFQSPAGAHLLQASSSRDHHLDTPMSGTDTPILLSRADSALQHQVPAITTSASFQTIPATMMPPPTPSEAIVDSIDAQIQFLQQQKLQHQQRQIEEQQAAFFVRHQNRMVPPTPQSMDLQARTNQFFSQPNGTDQHQHQHQQQTPGIDYRYQRLKEQQDMSFTPLVSPAVTPLETHFPIDNQFTVPGAYFSPLSSPALHAQNDSMAIFNQRHGTATTSSPGDMDLETTGPPLPNPGLGDLAKKIRKNASKARSKVGVKQSPISKPMRRKTTTTPTMNALVLSDLVESAEQGPDRHPQSCTALVQTSASSTTGATDSENGSVSPQALNDMMPIEMPPPPVPKPRSAKPSPYIAPQSSGVSTGLQTLQPGALSPATPASLMKLSSPNNRNSTGGTGSQDPADTEHIESLELPEPASAPKPTRPSVITRTSTLSAPDANPVKTPGLTPLPSPRSARPPATTPTTQSPQLMMRPGSETRKTPLLLPRGSKKRPSVSSVQVSPALRPKISPNIKPLLPGGASAEDTASHLLATKSNYQRILEGNTVPGVSYPSELSTNLTSKRTSHKIAEQGRRNRINSALQEIATLLPQAPKDIKESKESEGDSDNKKDKSGNSVPNSKASTVELAIEYIKQLQQEVVEANRRAEEAEKRLGLKMVE
ncbi:helix-loop-helix DNA-binding domain-containing protein [Lasiosphaeria ovina]|uniref:Helix-loop-helix DNA-binding domain-containing protein n=1 Tax=Lasiosphaeria ovina TaxID=92902 RepID=A0AAE0JV96_9PEZI|nr:helix-loop-helix DNA-binding domain-containing protein [Lasiosphaeria ovina]